MNLTTNPPDYPSKTIELVNGMQWLEIKRWGMGAGEWWIVIGGL